jgi:DNA-binding MarR family transcriptional regulator
MLRGWGLVLQVEQGGHGIGVLGILVVVAVLFLVLNSVWRQDRQRKAARDRALADRLLECIYQQPDEPVNLTRLARQVHLRPSVVKQLCEGKLIREGYLHHKRRPRKDRVDKLFLSPSGREAMERRKQSKS